MDLDIGKSTIFGSDLREENKISAVIITLNEERNIGRCLTSLKNVADEILVLDSHSTDSTKDICEENGANVINVEWKGYTKTKNYGISLTKHEYILAMDADEALSAELQKSVLEAKSKGLSGVYEYNRLTNYCGKWIRHCGWYPDRKLRLFPKSKARWEGEYVHEDVVFDNDLSRTHLNGDLLHYSYYKFQEHLERVHKYTSLSAQKMKDEKRSSSYLKGLSSAVFRFLKMYFLQLGLLDGKEGFNICRISAYAVLLKYRKLRLLK